LLGGLISAIVCAMYAYTNDNLNGYNNYTFDEITTAFPAFATLNATPYKQGGLQVAGTFVSIGIAIVFGAIAGLIINFFYSFR